ncbi:MAG: carbohydrate ABC transporter permease [Erysipelotrichaceae bacterium]|nr:carbohydrate ABC transporter permease [Erysipelotrichaceae bacterium]
MLKKSQLARTAKKTNRTITFWLLVGSLSVFFPLYMTIMIAFKDPSQMSNSIAGILAFPKSWSFDNFQQAMAITDFWHTLSNSILITGATMIVAVIFHSLIGYAIGRSMQKRGYRLLYLYIISGMFVPFAIIMMPIVKQTAMLGIDNRFGVVLLYSIFYLPMNLMLYTGYLKNIPLSLEEAAAIDGASTFKTFWSVIFPLMKPMHATVAVLTALGTWNDVMLPLVLLSGTGQNTLPIAQLNFQSQFGTNYNLAFASYLLALIPILIIYIIGQKQIIKGVVNGAIK